MKATEIIQSLREAFNEMVNPTPVQEVKLIEAILKDGTKVEVTELAVGGIVTIESVPAPTGEHELQDGTIIVVGENGAITEIKEMEVAEPPMVEDMGARFSAFENSTSEKFAAYESKFAAYESKFAEYEVKLNKAYGIIDGLINLTKQLSESPTGKADISIKTENSFKVAEPKFNYEGLF